MRAPTKVVIDRELLKMAKDSYRQYAAVQELKKQQQSEAQKHVQEKRKATIDLKNAVAKKKAVVEEFVVKYLSLILKFMPCKRNYASDIVLCIPLYSF